MVNVRDLRGHRGINDTNIARSSPRHVAYVQLFAHSLHSFRISLSLSRDISSICRTRRTRRHTPIHLSHLGFSLQRNLPRFAQRLTCCSRTRRFPTHDYPPTQSPIRTHPLIVTHITPELMLCRKMINYTQVRKSVADIPKNYTSRYT